MSVLPEPRPESTTQEPAAATGESELQAAACRPLGATPWAVLLCKFSDVADQPHDPAFFADFLTLAGNGKGGMADFWRDMSVGRSRWTGRRCSAGSRSISRWLPPGAGHGPRLVST